MAKRKPREAKMILSAGKKGVGKTYQTLKLITKYIRTTAIKKGRKFLIFDVNNEFGNVKKDHKNPNFPKIHNINLNQVRAFGRTTAPIVARVSIFKDSGQQMSMSEMSKALGYILANYRNGGLLIEDLTKFVTDSMPGDLIGMICTQRHVSVDVVIHFQLMGKLFHPKLWGTCTEVRMHKTEDTVKRHESKVSGNIEHLQIMEALIAQKYAKGDHRFFCYLDKDYSKIKGNFSKLDFIKAIESYLESNYNKVLKPLLDKRHIYTGEKLYQNQKQAVNAYIVRLMRQYL